MRLAELGPENDCAGEDQHQLQTTESYIRTTSASVQLENKITGRGSQGACRQDELIGRQSQSDSHSEFRPQLYQNGERSGMM
jgi:hypothetical protein